MELPRGTLVPVGSSFAKNGSFQGLPASRKSIPWCSTRRLLAVTSIWSAFSFPNIGMRLGTHQKQTLRNGKVAGWSWAFNCLNAAFFVKDSDEKARKKRIAHGVNV